jgi:hypothetical protein
VTIRNLRGISSFPPLQSAHLRVQASSDLELLDSKIVSHGPRLTRLLRSALIRVDPRNGFFGFLPLCGSLCPLCSGSSWDQPISENLWRTVLIRVHSREFAANSLAFPIAPQVGAQRSEPNSKSYDHCTAARPDTRSTDRLRHDTGGPSRGIVDAHE